LRISKEPIVAPSAANILAQLSSQVHDRTARSNLKAAARCLKEPALLDAIAWGLTEHDAALVGDCAEVLTEVTREDPLVARYAKDFAPLMNHATTRVRWEAMHALARWPPGIPGSSPPFFRGAPAGLCGKQQRH